MKLIIQLSLSVCYFLPFSANGNFGSYNGLYNIFHSFFGIKTLIYHTSAPVIAISSRPHV